MQFTVMCVMVDTQVAVPCRLVHLLHIAELPYSENNKILTLNIKTSDTFHSINIADFTILTQIFHPEMNSYLFQKSHHIRYAACKLI